MSDIKVLVWLFPVIFIFHDFEEIIFMQPWISRNSLYLSKRFPALSKRVLPHFGKITTASFAAGVAEEFLLISVITVVSYLTDWYSLWIGLFIAFTIHLVIHCLQALAVGKYVPSIVTSVICLPLCVYIIKYSIILFPVYTIVLYSVLGLVIMAVNLIAVHRGMDVFSRWLSRYGQTGK